MDRKKCRQEQFHILCNAGSAQNVNIIKIFTDSVKRISLHRAPSYYGPAMENVVIIFIRVNTTSSESDQLLKYTLSSWFFVLELNEIICLQNSYLSIFAVNSKKQNSWHADPILYVFFEDIA